MAIEKVGLRIDANVSGADQVDNLTTSMVNLDEVAPHLANEIRDLQARFDQLKAAQGAVDAFKQAKIEAEQLRVALEKQKQATADYAQSLKSAESSLTSITQKQQQYKQAVSNLDADLRQFKSELSALKTEIQNSGGATAAQAQAYLELERRITETSTALKASRTALKSVSTEVSQLTRSAAEQKRAFDQSRASARELAAQYQQQRQTLAGLRQELQQSGINSNNLAAAQSNIRKEFAATSVQASNLATQLSRVNQIASRSLPNPARNLGAGLSSASGSASQLASGLGNLRTAASAVGLLALAREALQLSGAALQATAGMQRLERTLTSLTGDSTAAQTGIANLVAEANRLGISVSDLRQPFGDYIGATQTLGVSTTEATRQLGVFVEAMVRSGRSSVEVSDTLLGLVQSIRQGNVQWDEFRQIASRIPGVFTAMSKAFGVAEDELKAFVATGNATFDQSSLLIFIEELGKAVKTTGEQLQGIDQSNARFSNSLNVASATLTKASGAAGLYQSAVDRIAKSVQLNSRALGDFIIGLQSSGKSSAELGKELVELDQQLGLLEAPLGIGENLDKNLARAQASVKEFRAELDALLRGEVVDLGEVKTRFDEVFGDLKADKASTQIKNLVADFTDLRRGGLLSAEEFQAKFADAISRLSDEDLPKFAKAIEELNKTGGVASQTFKRLGKAIQDELLSRDFKNIGIDFETATGRLTAQSQSVIDSFINVSKQVEDSDLKLLALSNSLEKIQSPVGIQEIEKSLLQAGLQGDDLQRALQLVQDRLAEVQVENERLAGGLNRTDAILKNFGVASSDSLIDGFDKATLQLQQLARAGDATAKDLQQAFFNSTNAIIKKFGTLNESQRQQVASLIQAQAEAVGLGDKLSQAAIQTAIASGNTSKLTAELEKAKEAAFSTTKSIFGVKAAFDGSLESVQAVRDALNGIGNNTDEIKTKTGDYKTTVDGTVAGWENLTEEQKQAIIAQSKLNAAAEFFNEVIAGLEAKLAEVSDAAKVAFQERITGNADTAGEAIDSLTDRIAKANSEIIRLGSIENSPSQGAFSQIAAFYGRVAAEVELSALRQQDALENLARQAVAGNQSVINQLTVSGDALQSLRDQFDLVDQSTFDGIIGEVQRLNGELSSAADRTQQLEDRLKSLQATSDVERQQIENQSELRRIQEEIDAARAAGNAQLEQELQKQLDLQKQINNEELKRIKNAEERAKAEEKARKAADAANAANNQNDSNNTQQTQRRNGTAPVNGTVPQFQQPTSIQPILVTMTDKQADSFIRRGLTDDVVRDVVRTSLDRVNKFRK